MIMDAQNLFSDAQAVTAAAASTNIIDLSAAGSYVGVGKPLYIVINCDVAMTDGSSDSTLAVTLQQDTTAAFGSATDIQTICTFPATSAIGTRYQVAIDPGIISEQFIRLYYTPANGNLTTGSFTAGIVETVDEVNHHADGFTIS